MKFPSGYENNANRTCAIKLEIKLFEQFAGEIANEASSEKNSNLARSVIINRALTSYLLCGKS